MDVFLVNVVSFPVIVYTFLLFVMVFYWILAFVGILDIELLDADVDLEFDQDFDLNMDLGTDVETPNLSGITGFMLRWGLTGIPVTVVVSLLILFSWMICYFIVSIFYSYIPWESLKTLIGIAVLIFSFLLSVPLTAKLIRPFKGIFVTHSAVSKVALIGKVCLVKTGSVTETFGQGEMEDGGAGMILDVRADKALGIKKGDTVVLIEYDSEDGSFTVAKAE